jgi:hypothetical protein
MSLKEDPTNPKKEVEYDRGLMFREKEWKKALKDFPDFKTHVQNDLEKHLIVKYGETPADFGGDSDSLLDVEAALEVAQGG